MRQIKGIFPIFKALMAIVYLLLGAAILVFPKLLLPVNNSFGTVLGISFGTILGIVLVLYGTIRVYASFVDYAALKGGKGDEEL